MAHLAPIDLAGYWLGIFLTLCILSFLYKDNPFYKFAEHLFIGVSIGYVVMKQYFDVVDPKILGNLFPNGFPWPPWPWHDFWGFVTWPWTFLVSLAEGEWWYLFALLLAVALLMKAFRRFAWVGRYPIAFVVGFYAGLQINGVAQGDLAGQIKPAMEPLVEHQVDVNRAAIDELNQLPGFSTPISEKVVARRQAQPYQSLDELEETPDLSDKQRAILTESRGTLEGLDAQAAVGREPSVYWFGTLNKILLLLGLLAGLVYFYFSAEQKGAIGKVSRVGIWVLMIGFGASFGYTVQGRIALAIGRALDVLGRDKAPELAEEIQGGLVALVCAAVIACGLVLWEMRNRRRIDRSGRSQASSSTEE